MKNMSFMFLYVIWTIYCIKSFIYIEYVLYILNELYILYYTEPISFQSITLNILIENLK